MITNNYNLKSNSKQIINYKTWSGAEKHTELKEGEKKQAKRVRTTKGDINQAKRINLLSKINREEANWIKLNAGLRKPEAGRAEYKKHLIEKYGLDPRDPE